MQTTRFVVFQLADFLLFFFSGKYLIRCSFSWGQWWLDKDSEIHANGSTTTLSYKFWTRQQYSPACLTRLLGSIHPLSRRAVRLHSPFSVRSASPQAGRELNFKCFAPPCLLTVRCGSPFPIFAFFSCQYKNILIPMCVSTGTKTEETVHFIRLLAKLLEHHKCIFC